ncbi:uncharacterized protein LOC144445306 [Glandiceps talaboti]
MESRYKARSAAVGRLDAKAVRRHRRSILQKTARDEKYDKTRNLPLIDETEAKTTVQEQRDIRELLKKWKQERDLKRKLDKEKSTKKTFKVHHVCYNDRSLYSSQDGKQNVQKKLSATSVSRPVTRSSARLANRNSHDATAATTKTKKPAMNTEAKKNPERRSKRLASQVSMTSTTMKKETKKQTASSGSDSDVRLAKAMRFDASKVTSSRGQDGTSSQEESFAPSGFQFTAHFSIADYEFKPLSPASKGEFFRSFKHRVSTPSRAKSELPMFASDVSSITTTNESQSDENTQAPAGKAGKNSTGARPKHHKSERQRWKRGDSELSSSDESDKESRPLRRSSRRSVSFALSTGESEVKTPQQHRKPSGRKSTPYVKSYEKRVRIMDPEEDMELENVESVTPVTRKRSVSEHKATPAVRITHQDSEMADDENDSTPIIRKSRRISGRHLTPGVKGHSEPISMGSDVKDHPEPISTVEKVHDNPETASKSEASVNALRDGLDDGSRSETPTGRSRRPSGRRLTPAPKLALVDEDVKLTPRRSRRLSEKVVEPTQKDEMEAAVVEKKDDVAMETDTLAGTEEHNIPYFRGLVDQETARLRVKCKKWLDYKDSQELSEDVIGQIAAVTGKAELLIRGKFKQFLGLIDDCEFHRGEKEVTCMDLQGFWDLIAWQVETVDAMFADLEKMKMNNWQKEVAQPKQVKKVVKKTKTVVAKSSKASEAREAARKRLAKIKAAMKAKHEEEKEEEESAEAAEKCRSTEMRTFDAGFFSVSSPVRQTKPHCEAGTPSKRTPGSRRDTGPLTNTSSSPALMVLRQSLHAKMTPKTTPTTRLRQSLSTKTTPKNSVTQDATNDKDVDNNASQDWFTKYLVPSKLETPQASKTRLSTTLNTPGSISVVDLNQQAEQFMKTEPEQQLQDLQRTPLKIKQTHQCDKQLATPKSESLSSKFSKIRLQTNTPSQTSLESENLLYTPVPITDTSSALNVSNLMSFDSPSNNDSNQVLVGGLYSPMDHQPLRRSTRRSTANPNPSIFSPL